jgi:perosamine synthetase
MIPHNRPTLGKLEAAAASKVIESGYLSQGSEVKAFEDECCHFLGLPLGHAVALSSGTAALFLALWVLKAEGKRVAFPAYSCSSLRHAVHMAQAKEVLLDSMTELPNLQWPSAFENNFNIGIVPHMYGIPANWESTLDVAIIEDCCQSLGAIRDGQRVGLKGDLGVFSFYATKLITTGGQGGLLVSKDFDLVAAARDYREFDCRKDYRKRFNFQMTDLQAAIGRVQLRRLPKFLDRRDEIYRAYLSGGLDLLNKVENSRLNTSVRYRSLLLVEQPHEFCSRLEQFKIKAIVPTEDWELLGPPDLYPNANKWTKTLLSLPIYPTLSTSEVDHIIKSVQSVNQGFKR